MATSRLSVTVWRGQMQLDGGHTATWTARPGASLWAFGLAADWRVTGPGTDLAGPIVIRPGAVDLGPVSGAAAWPLIAALMPGLPITCTGQARLSAVAVRLAEAERTGAGTVTSPDAECRRLDGQSGPVPAPALHAQISTQPDAVQILVTPQVGARVALLTARLTNADRLVVTIHPDGAALVPGMPATADSEIDLPLAVLIGG